MERCKICPSCGTKNNLTLFECEYCGADLSSVRISSINTEQPRKIKPIKQLYRICSCGETNPSNARKCRRCNENISDVIPVPIGEETETHKIIFESIDKKFRYEMKSSSIIIGREGIMSEYLANKPYVSRTHCKISFKEGKVYIENLSKTNFTYLNNKKVSSLTKVNTGDEIGLGGINNNGKRQAAAAYLTLKII